MNIEIKKADAEKILTFLKGETGLNKSSSEEKVELVTTPEEIVPPVEEKVAEYPVLNRRNTGIKTNEGNVWINPADREWLSKSAAYQNVSWEDYCALTPGETPEGIETFFNK